MNPWPPTVIVVHPRENRRKCTVESLRGVEDFVFCQPTRPAPDLSGYIRLGLEGPMLSRDDTASGLLILDGTWRLVGQLEEQFESVPIRTLPSIRTAYPRISKVFDDPRQGLATIEAIYAAYLILGRPTTGLLDRYYWRDAFLNANREWIAAFAMC